MTVNIPNYKWAVKIQFQHSVAPMWLQLIATEKQATVLMLLEQLGRCRMYQDVFQLDSTGLMNLDVYLAMILWGYQRSHILSRDGLNVES